MDNNTIPIPTSDICQTQQIIEAILFAAGHPVTYEKLASVLHQPVAQIQNTVQAYADQYNQQNGTLPRGIQLLVFEDSCQLCTIEQYGEYIREALGIRRGGNLSASSLEVLAIVAYHEPVTRAYIDTVRGVDSSYAVNSLCEKHLLEPCGRMEAPGRPLLYRTTPDFLRVFGISSLQELPQLPASQSAQSIASTESVSSEEE